MAGGLGLGCADTFHDRKDRNNANNAERERDKNQKQQEEPKGKTMKNYRESNDQHEAGVWRR